MIHLKKKIFHPDNIFSCAIPHIGDLGLCIFEKQANNFKDIKSVIPYIAPELLNGRGPYFPATDVYAFSIVYNWRL